MTPGVRANGKKRTTSMNINDRRRRIRALLRRDGPQCWICGGAFVEEPERGPYALSLDHLVSRQAGGSDALPNLRLAHRLCNDRRSNPPLGRRREASDGLVAS